MNQNSLTSAQASGRFVHMAFVEDEESAGGEGVLLDTLSGITYFLTVRVTAEEVEAVVAVDRPGDSAETRLFFSGVRAGDLWRELAILADDNTNARMTASLRRAHELCEKYSLEDND